MELYEKILSKTPDKWHFKIYFKGDPMAPENVQRVTLSPKYQLTFIIERI